MVVSQIARTCLGVCAIFANLSDAVRILLTHGEQLTQSHGAKQETVLEGQVGDLFEGNLSGSDNFFPPSIVRIPPMVPLAPISSIVRLPSTRPAPFLLPLTSLRGTIEDVVTRSVEELSYSKDLLRALALEKKDNKRLFQVDEAELKLAHVRAEFLEKAHESVKQDTPDSLEKYNASIQSLLDSEERAKNYLAGKSVFIMAFQYLKEAYKRLWRAQKGAKEAAMSEQKAFVDFEAKLSALMPEKEEFMKSFESFTQTSKDLMEAYEYQQNASKRAVDDMEDLVGSAEDALRAYMSLKQALSDSKDKVDTFSRETDAFVEFYRSDSDADE